jgi:hypothetical protein
MLVVGSLLARHCYTVLLVLLADSCTDSVVATINLVLLALLLYHQVCSPLPARLESKEHNGGYCSS